MNKLIIRATVFIFAASLNAATASAQNMPSLSSLMEQFGMNKFGMDQLGDSKLPQLPTTAGIPKQDVAGVKQQPSIVADQAIQLDSSKAMNCINAYSNDLNAKFKDLAKQLSATKKGTVPLTAEQNSSLDEAFSKLPIGKDSVVTRGKFAMTAEQEQITSAFIKNNSDFSGSTFLKCASKK